MKCLILAAGYATRLYPLTENFPKPVLKVREKAILDWLMDDLSQTAEVEEYLVVSNHRYADHFVAWAKTRPEKIRIIDDGTVSNETRLGAVRDILLAVEQTGTDTDLVVLAGDNVLDFSLGKFLRYAKEKGATCLMRYAEPDTAKLHKCGVITIDGTDRITSMEEKPAEPKSNWCCPPFYYLKREDLRLVGDAITAGCGIDAPGSLFAWLSAKVPVYAMEMPGKRYDIGNLESYETVQRIYRGILNA